MGGEAKGRFSLGLARYWGRFLVGDALALVLASCVSISLVLAPAALVPTPAPDLAPAPASAALAGTKRVARFYCFIETVLADNVPRQSCSQHGPEPELSCFDCLNLIGDSSLRASEGEMGFGE